MTNINIYNGYLVGLSNDCGQAVDSKTMDSIMAALAKKPNVSKAKSGTHQYMLTYPDLKWTLVEIKETEEETKNKEE